MGPMHAFRRIWEFFFICTQQRPRVAPLVFDSAQKRNKEEEIEQKTGS
jgi:hypothetical protein